MTFYVFLNWILCLFTALTILLILLKKRYLIIKPSIAIAILFHLQIQWAAAIDSSSTYYYLPNPWPFLVCSQVFPFMTILFSLMFFRGKCEKIYYKIIRIKDDEYGGKEINILFALVLLTLVFYFSKVPFRTTGLYSLLKDPMNSGMARENSLKLIDSQLLKYAYSIMRSSIAPILSIYLFYSLKNNFKKRKFSMSFVSLACFMTVFFSVSLTGSRGAMANIFLCIVAAVFLKSGLPLNPVKMLIAALILFSIPVMTTILRQGESISVSIFFKYMFDGIIQRAFYEPMEMGLYYFHYAQSCGFFGATGFSVLAKISGNDVLWIPNIIGRTYLRGALESVNANATFVFSNYSYIGILSIFLSFASVWSLDMSLYVAEKLDGILLLSVVACIICSSIYFVSGDFTSNLISNGFLMTLIISVFLRKAYVGEKE